MKNTRPNIVSLHPARAAAQLPGRSPGVTVSAAARQTSEETESLVHELQVARNIQAALLPRIFPPLPGFGFAGFCHCARHVGGDFYDVVPVGEDSALLVVADVMGKGVPAALFAASVRALIRTLVDWTHSPSEVLTRVNRLMFQELSSVDMFVTAQLALLDAGQRQLTVASAGHCPLLLSSPTGAAQSVSPEGLPLGIAADAFFAEAVHTLPPSACALLYTDGLTEVRNTQGEFFGQPRLEGLLGLHLEPGQTAIELKQKLLAELEQFGAGAAAADDQTLLIVCEERAKCDVASAPSPSEQPLIVPIEPSLAVDGFDPLKRAA